MGEKQQILVSSIFESNGAKRGTLQLASLQHDSVLQILSQFGEELDDHRISINENTTEIQSGIDCIEELNSKIDRMAEQIVKLTLLVTGKNDLQTEFNIRPLSSKEKEVFTAFYSLSDSGASVTYRMLSKKVELSEQLVASFIGDMIEKGVPIKKRYSGNIVLLYLDDKFREMQAKKNLLGVNSLLNYFE